MNKKENIYNFANLLSISRIFVIFPLIYFLSNSDVLNYIFFSKIAVSYIVLSDVLDGYFARRANIVTGFGKIIDPVADKICLWMVLIFLISKYHLPFLIFLILLSLRDFILTSYSVYLLINHQYVSQANFHGKLFIMITMFMLIAFIYEVELIYCYILYFLSILMLIVSTLKYIESHKIKINEYESV